MPGDTKTRKQVAALPVRLTERGGIEVRLVTSRETMRWIIPKGWPMKGRKDHRAAAIEAEEEAGVTGAVLRKSIGSYGYWRRGASTFEWMKVKVFLVRVEKELSDWKEKDQRRTGWFPLADAARQVLEPELETLLTAVPRSDAVRQFLRMDGAPDRQ